MRCVLNPKICPTSTMCILEQVHFLLLFAGHQPDHDTKSSFTEKQNIVRFVFVFNECLEMGCVRMYVCVSPNAEHSQ